MRLDGRRSWKGVSERMDNMDYSWTKNGFYLRIQTFLINLGKKNESVWLTWLSLLINLKDIDTFSYLLPNGRGSSAGRFHRSGKKPGLDKCVDSYMRQNQYVEEKAICKNSKVNKL